MDAPRLLRPAFLLVVALGLGLTGCGDDGDSSGDDPRTPVERPDSETGEASPPESVGTTATEPLHECASLWNAADLDEVRSVFAAQHRQDSAETGAPDVVVGNFQGEPFVLTGSFDEVTVPDGACVVVDVEGTTVDAEPQFGGYAAALVDDQWTSAVTTDHPLAQHPLPIVDPQLVTLAGGFEDPVLAVP